MAICAQRARFCGRWATELMSLSVISMDVPLARQAERALRISARTASSSKSGEATSAGLGFQAIT